MTDLSDIDPGRVLEMSPGSGYQAALLSLSSREVHSEELVMPLGRDVGDQFLERMVKRADCSLERRVCLDVRFVPLVRQVPES